MPSRSNSLLTTVRQTMLLAYGLFMLPPPPQKQKCTQTGVLYFSWLKKYNTIMRRLQIVNL